MHAIQVSTSREIRTSLHENGNGPKLRSTTASGCSLVPANTRQREYAHVFGPVEKRVTSSQQRPECEKCWVRSPGSARAKVLVTSGVIHEPVTEAV